MVSDDTTTKSESKPSDSGSASDTSAGYSRGENQKPVSKAYKNNWQAIFGKPAKAKATKKKR